MFLSQVGQRRTVAGRERLSVRNGESGYVLYGPYVLIPPGRYAVAFSVEGEDSVSSDARAVRLDVAGNYGAFIVAERTLTSGELSREVQPVAMPFEVRDEGIFEFRVFAEGTCSFSVDAECPLSVVGDDGALSPVTPVERGLGQKIYEDFFGTFRYLERCGARLATTGSEVLLDFQGLHLRITNSEDAQVLEELYLQNAYSFITKRRSMVVDVGMNVGMTSLYLARMDAVQEVHSFEPFASPYRRALTNFALNPDYAGKITAHPFGLGGRDEDIEVLAHPDHTIGVSIKGAGFGEAETIRLKNAVGVIGPLAKRAQAEGLDLIVKIDCEGSEFAIFDTLEQAQLLASVTAFAVEWHKWWSKDKTQADLIRPLLDAGFVVLDQTHPDNPLAGMFYAVRTAR